MTSGDEATRPVQGAAAQLREDRPPTVSMVTRCALRSGGGACCLPLWLGATGGRMLRVELAEVRTG